MIMYIVRHIMVQNVVSQAVVIAVRTPILIKQKSCRSVIIVFIVTCDREGCLEKPHIV